MHVRSRASSGIRSNAAGGIDAVKHQQVSAPAAMPQSFGPPHSGQTSWAGGAPAESDTARV
jgi:hypothetical protein